MKLDVFIDPETERKVRESLDPKNVPKALSAASNRVLTGMKTFTARTVQKTLNLTQAEIKERITVKKGSPSSPGGFLKISRKAVPLVRYGARQTRPGVTVACRKGQGRQLLAHTFLATMKSGHRGVFVREDIAARVPTLKSAIKKIGTTLGISKKKHGLPIRELYGPTIVGVVAGDGTISKRIEDYAAYEMVKQMESQISRFGAIQAAEAAEANNDSEG